MTKVFLQHEALRSVRSVQTFEFGRRMPRFLAGLAMAMDAGGSKAAFPFCGHESDSLFVDLRRWLRISSRCHR
jgi:hypothetical protein